MRAPIALFVYNRLDHTQKTVAALQANLLASESELFIFSDGAKDVSDQMSVDAVRKYIRAVNDFKNINIIERDVNMGLARSIISGVTEIVNRYGKIIVLEDDLVSSPYFLTYMNEALDLYENEEKVISIHGYIYPLSPSKTLPETFFLKNPSCWGWATWKRGWDIFESDGAKLLRELEAKKLTREFDFDDSYRFSETLRRQVAGQRDSWAVRWYASAFLADKLTLYPGKSLIDNTGFDGSGKHSGETNAYRTSLENKRVNIAKIPVVENADVRAEITRYFESLKPGLLKRLYWKIFRTK